MPGVMFPGSHGAGAGPARSKTFKGYDSSNSSSATYTFASKDIGTNVYQRYVVVGAHWTTGAISLTGMSVGGLACTIGLNARVSGVGVAFGCVAVPAGSSADIVVTMSGGAGIDNCAIGWWVVNGLSSTTPVDTGTSTVDPGTDTLNVASGDFVFGITSNEENTSTNVVWTNLSEDYEIAVESRNNFSGASGTASGATISPSANYTVSSNPHAGFVAYR